MSNLSDIEQKLYAKDPKLEGHSVDPQLQGGVPGAGQTGNQWTQPPKAGLPQKALKRTLIIIGAFVAALAVLIGFTLFSLSRNFVLDNVRITIAAPEDIASGSLVEWRVTVLNRNQAAIRGGQLDFEFPTGAFATGLELTDAANKNRPAERVRELLGDIGSNQSAEKVFKARLMGAKEDAKFAKATLTFSPNGVTTRLERVAQSSTRISSVPVSLTVQAPNQLLAGDEIFYEIAYFNASTLPLNNLTLQVVYPPDFTFVNANPLPQSGNSWPIESLPASGQGIIKIHGVLGGDRDELEALRATLQGEIEGAVVKFAEATAATQMLGSPLKLNITANDSTEASVNIGQSVKYKIIYENTFDVPLENLTLTATLVGNIFDISTLNTRGAFDIASSTITWGGFERPDLKLLQPNKPGEVDFTVSMRDRLPILSSLDKNFTVQVNSTLRTDQVPVLIGGSKIERRASLATKLNTRLVVQPKLFYRETSSTIQNYGPMPPRQGETTTFTAHLSVVNVANDADNVVVKAAIPTGVTWTGQFSANYKPEGVVYDPNLKIVTWNIGKVLATTGIAQATKELVFQVSYTPVSATGVSSHDLVTGIVITGTDTFTGVPLRAEAISLNPTSAPDLY